jgi:hypothetical protein
MSEQRLSLDKVTVVYILGYGRSGSTFMDILLNNAEGATSIGAPSNFFYWLEHGQPCGCGKPLQECEYWSGVVRDYAAELGALDPVELRRIQLAVERRRHYRSLLNGRLPEALTREYGRSQELLYRIAARHAGTNVLIDSSNSGAESLGRAYALAMYAPGLNMRIIHLVRDGRGVSWSAIKTAGSPERRRWPMPRPVRAGKTALSWAVTNRFCLMTADRVGSDNVLTVRYEDIVSQPAVELARIGAFADFDVSAIMRKVENHEELEVGHNVGGNRLRFNRRIRIQPDWDWARNMPASARLIATAAAWPMLRHFGYPLTLPAVNGR